MYLHDTLHLRPVVASDQEAIITLIDTIFREYGDRVCLENADRDLLDLTRYYQHGDFMVLDDAGTIRATVALIPVEGQPHACEIKRVYLDASLRGSGWGARLVEWAKSTARTRGMQHMECWSDTRFDRGHAFYLKQGFEKTGRIRSLNDGWKPYEEFFFSLAL